MRQFKVISEVNGLTKTFSHLEKIVSSFNSGKVANASKFAKKLNINQQLKKDFFAEKRWKSCSLYIYCIKFSSLEIIVEEFWAQKSIFCVVRKLVLFLYLII